MYPYQSDEVSVSKPKESKSNKKSDKKSDSKIKAVKIDFKNFENRVVALSTPAGDYNNLQSSAKQVFVLKAGENGNQLQVINLEKDDKPASVLDGAMSYELSADGNKILVRKGNDFAIVDAKAKQKFNDSKLDLKNLTLKIDPKTEWQQMYVDGWRVFRDWFYDPNIHGMDWNNVREKYQPWVNAATHRTDLDYAFGEIAGELNAGHIYVNSGDQPKVERRKHGLLGAEVSNHSSGYFKIDKIFWLKY